MTPYPGQNLTRPKAAYDYYVNPLRKTETKGNYRT